MKYILILHFTVTSIYAKENCKHIMCSDVIDHVCGMATSIRDGTGIISKFQNICHMAKIQCRLQHVVEIKQIPDALCSISKDITMVSGRRVADFSVVGAHQACSHTCPTYCVDSYEPACAQIWLNEETYKKRPMINHCHIDLFSCAFGFKVTILPLGSCYHNPSSLQFMSHVAAMKSLRLLEVDDVPVKIVPQGKSGGASNIPSRRSNDAVDMQIYYFLRRIFK